MPLSHKMSVLGHLPTKSDIFSEIHNIILRTPETPSNARIQTLERRKCRCLPGARWKGAALILIFRVCWDRCTLMNARPRMWHDQCALQLEPQQRAPYKDFLVLSEMAQGPCCWSGGRLHPPQMVQSRRAPFLLISCDAKTVELNLYKIVVLIPTLN